MAGKHVTSPESVSARRPHRVRLAGRCASSYEDHELIRTVDEPRRSGRANRGQHKGHASPSPAPNAKQPKAAASKKGKKAAAAQQVSRQASEAGDDDDEAIRCICGNDDPNDKRAFISCDACSVWQHNICMGMHDDEDEVGEHYFCEQCRPEEHEETIQALERGDKIWETRNKAYNTEKKMSKNRKAKSGRPSWLKKEIKAEPTPASSGKGAAPTPTPAPAALPAETKETGNKRKRESEVAPPPAPEAEPQAKPAAEKPPSARQEKRRKSSNVEKKPAAEDPDTALIPIDKLPAERKKIAQALAKIMAGEVEERANASKYQVPDGQTPKSVAERHASRIEYALQMNHDGPTTEAYKTQFRMLLANLKQNKALLDELLSGSLTADELATMSSSEMASDKLQKERAEMKAVADRQATIDQSNVGQKYRHTHKGMELIEDENATVSSAPVARPVRHSISEADGAGSPKPGAETQRTSQTPVENQRSSVSGADRRPSSQQNFDVNSIWAKTAGSPTQANARPPQPPSHRPSVVQNQQDGAKEDADVDRMLADGDDSYEPPDHTGDSSVVWRGKLVQTSGDAEPTVNARFVAGRDVAETIPWRDLLPGKLNIDGRLQISKAEEYLCGLQWSSSSDVAVLALTPYDDAAAFNSIFEYFLGKNRYAVVNKDRPSLVKDLYIIPVEPGTTLPEHIEMLEHCTIKRPVEERMMLATFVVARAMGETQPTPAQQPVQHMNGNGHHLPSHMRQSLPGPAGSPIAPHFSPAQQFGPGSGSPIPPNPYSAQAPYQPPPQQQHSALAAQILGEFITAPSAQQILGADPAIDEDRLQNLRKILEEDVNARADITVLAAKLNVGPPPPGLA